MLGVLRFGAGGLPYFLFQSDGSLVWPEGGNLTDVRLVAPSNISAYSNQPLHVTGGKQNSVSMHAYHQCLLNTVFKILCEQFAGIDATMEKLSFSSIGLTTLTHLE